MANKYWFKPKWFGWGFYPVSWEGWLATFFLIVLILISGFLNGIFEENGTSMYGALGFFLDAILIAGVATLYFERKMKEPLKWRWGWKK